MAYVRFIVESQNLTLEQDVYNWRILQDAFIRIGNYDSFRGVRVALRDTCILLLGVSQNMFHELNKKPRDWVRNHTVYSTQPDYLPPACSKCRGAGKLDWVERATGVPFLMGHDYIARQQRFIRDPDHVLVYEKFKDHGTPEPAYYSTMDTILARSLVKKGEARCKHCHGTGLALDGRLQIFPNMPKLRRQLKLMKVNDYEAMGEG